MYTDPGTGLFLIQIAVIGFLTVSYHSRKWIRTILKKISGAGER